MKKAIIIGCALLFALVGTAWAKSGKQENRHCETSGKETNGKAWDAFGVVRMWPFV